MNSKSGMSLSEALCTQAQTSHDTDRFQLVQIEGASRGLKTRLLELGLVAGTIFSAEQRGSHFALKVRGDQLLLRTSEASFLKVQALTPLNHEEER